MSGEQTMNVYVLSGVVGFSKTLVEIFEDTEKGKEKAEDRKRELQALNFGWKLHIDILNVNRGLKIKNEYKN